MASTAELRAARLLHCLCCDDGLAPRSGSALIAVLSASLAMTQWSGGGRGGAGGGGTARTTAHCDHASHSDSQTTKQRPCEISLASRRSGRAALAPWSPTTRKHDCTVLTIAVVDAVCSQYSKRVRGIADWRPFRFRSAHCSLLRVWQHNLDVQQRPHQIGLLTEQLYTTLRQRPPNPRLSPLCPL